MFFRLLCFTRPHRNSAQNAKKLIGTRTSGSFWTHCYSRVNFPLKCQYPYIATSLPFCISFPSFPGIFCQAILAGYRRLPTFSYLIHWLRTLKSPRRLDSKGMAQTQCYIRQYNHTTHCSTEGHSVAYTLVWFGKPVHLCHCRFVWNTHIDWRQFYSYSLTSGTFRRFRPEVNWEVEVQSQDKVNLRPGFESNYNSAVSPWVYLLITRVPASSKQKMKKLD